MTLQRAASVASSVAASSYHDVAAKSEIITQDPEQDDLLQSPSLETGVFAVLFTLQGKHNQRNHYYWVLLKYIVMAWQIYATILTPAFGWDIDPSSTVWKCVSVINLHWFKNAGYGWYIAVLYIVASVLAVNLVLCVWVAWSFKEQKFEYVWPIKVVRYFSYVFLQLFDMTSMTFLQLGISCQYSKHGKDHLRLEQFPHYSCKNPPHIVNAILSGLLLMIFIIVALLFNMAEVEVNPASKLPHALGHSGAAMTSFGIKALLTLVGAFLGWPKVAAVAYCVLTAWLVWEYLRWTPNLLVWVNCLKSGVATSMLSVAVLQVVVVFLPHSATRSLTRVMVMVIGPAFIAGTAITWLRLRLFNAAVVRAFRTADSEAVKPQDIFHFAHPRDVEIAARCARVWTDLYTLEKTAVHLAEDIIKAGVALFPDSTFIALVYANFMLDMLGFSQTGAKQLESVRKFGPDLMCRFVLFVRHQQATQKAASSTVGKGGNMDLLWYVEYQRKQRTVLRYHKDALQAMANFWRILGSSTISFTSLSRSLETIDVSVSKAESAYRVAMELYNNSPRLVRLYARFVETIKQDPWMAAQYYEKADELEETKDYNGQGPSLPDGTPMSRIDDVEKGILVVNAFGDIQVANRKLHDIFGYSKGDLDGKNVTVLMPPHEAKRHPAILRRYIDSGDKAPPYFRHPVLGIHRERVVLTVRIAVTRASGLGEDSVFIGILELLPPEPGMGRVWVTREGIIVCCDPGFVTCFGYHPDDVIGMHLDKLLRSNSVKGAEGVGDSNTSTFDIWATNQANHDTLELVQRMLASAADKPDGNMDSTTSAASTTLCRVLHKYDVAKPCNILVRKDLVNPSVLEVRMKLVSDEPQLLMVVERKGAIRHMSGDLAKVLGVCRGGSSRGSGDLGQHADEADQHQVMLELMVAAPFCCLDDFLSSPWKAMHYKYRKYAKGGFVGLSGSWGCRAVIDDNSNFAGPTMQLVGMHGKPVFVHVAVSSREEDGEPMHVVRMARSSLETAIGERRVRVKVSLDGVVQELEQHGNCPVAYANPDGLFGFPANELVGCRLWNFLSLATVRSATIATANARQPPELDLLEEAEAAVVALTGRVYTDGGGSDRGVNSSEHLTWEPLNLEMYDQMITSTLQTPGIAWRVKIVSPRVMEEAAALGNPIRTSTVLAKATKNAILKLHVVVPKPRMRSEAPEPLVVHAELWLAEAVTGVLEIDGSGKVSGILEEDVRPAGLLFGLPREDVMGAPLRALLRLQPEQSAVGLLSDNGIAKKSALKASSRKGRIAIKVGPVHNLEAYHRDHQPLNLAVQVVGKPGLGNPVIAILRFTSRNFVPAQGAEAVRGKPGAGALCGFSHHGGFPHGRGAHVSLALGDLESKDPSAGRSLGKGTGTSSLQVREVPNNMQTGDLTGAASGLATLRLGPPMPSPDPLPSPAREDTDSPGVDTLSSTAPLPPPFSITPVSMPRVAGGVGAAAGVDNVSSSSVAPVALPGASVLAAGVAGLMKVRVQTQEKDGADGGAAAMNRSVAVDVSSTGRSSPEKPTSPPLEGPQKVYNKRPNVVVCKAGTSAAGSTVADGTGGDGATEACAAVQGRLPGVVITHDYVVDVELARVAPPHPHARKDSKGGAAGGKAHDVRPTTDLSMISLAPAEVGSDRGDKPTSMGSVNQWVATDGKFCRNHVESVNGKWQPDADLDEEGDDGAGSFDGVSHVTSSHVPSPPGSNNGTGGPTDYDYDNQQQPLPVRGGLHAVQHGGQYPNMHAHSQPYGGMVPRGQQPQQHNNHYQPYSQQQQNQHHHQHPHQQYQHMHQHLHQQQQYPHQQLIGGGEWEGNTTGGAIGGAAELAHVPGHRLRRSSFLGDGIGGRGGDGMSLDLADEHDSDGDSEMSGITGCSDDLGGEDSADYKRGKRYRKLIKMMNSPEAKKAINRLKFHTILAVMAAVSIHVLSFSLIITSIQKQSRALDRLVEAGGGQRYLQRALVAVRSLDQVYEGKASASTYDADDSEDFADDLLTYTHLYREVAMGVVQSNGENIKKLYYSSKMQVWSTVNITSNTTVFEDIALWDLMTRAFVSAKAIFQHHVSWHQQGVRLASLPPVEFLLRSGQALSPGMRVVIDSLLDTAIAWTNIVNNLQLTFLLVEGLCVAGFCAAGLMYMLKLAFDKRYELYETFLSIPIGLTRTLAAQTTHLLDEESDSQSDGEDDRERYDDGSPRATGQTGGGDGGERGEGLGGGGAKRKALFDGNPTFFDSAKDDLIRGEECEDIGDVSLRKGGATNASTAANVNRTWGADARDGDGNSLGGGRRPAHFRFGTKAGREGPKLLGDGRPSDMDESFGPLGDVSLLPAGPSIGKLKVLGRTSVTRRWQALLCGCLPPFLQRLLPGSSVQPTASKVDAGDPALSARRTLVRNSKVAKWMLSIVLVYSVLVILFYSVTFVILLDVTDEVALQGVADQTSERVYRTVFYAQELVAEEDLLAVPARVELLQNSTAALRDAYYTMRMGSEAWTVVGSSVERFPAVVGPGLIKGSPAMFDLFYADHQCLRLPENLPCPDSNHQFFQIAHSGADAMMMQLLTELGNLADETMAAVLGITGGGGTIKPGYNSSHWEFILTIGAIDLHDACLRICKQHIDDVKGVLRVVVVLHVILLLLLLGLFVAFLMLGYLPLLHRMEKEKRRIAEMMSQLPTELDIMKLFSSALMGSGKASTGGGNGVLQMYSRKDSQTAPASSGGGGGNGADGGSVHSTSSVKRLGSATGGAAPRSASPVVLARIQTAASGSGSSLKDGSLHLGHGDASVGLVPEGAVGSATKNYQAWKDILLRTSGNGVSGPPVPSVIPRAAQRKSFTLTG